MLVYRICLEKWSHELKASGRGARWNSEGTFVIYTAASRALACLENIVHRSGEGITSLFHVMTIEIPDSLPISEVTIKQLPDDWFKAGSCQVCKVMGDRWVSSAKTCVMKVPSAIIEGEHNFLINPLHKSFDQIKLKSSVPFRFDSRI